MNFENEVFGWRPLVLNFKIWSMFNFRRATGTRNQWGDNFLSTVDSLLILLTMKYVMFALLI